MKKLSLFSFALIGLLIVPSVFAYQKGENRILEGNFEFDEAGKKPEKWEIAKGG